MTDSHVSLKRKWIGFAMSSGDALTGVPDAATRLPATFQVDYLRVYAYDPAADPIGGAAPAGTPRTAGPPATAASAVGRFPVLMSEAGAAVAVVAVMIVGYARVRARRRLRPAHRA